MDITSLFKACVKTLKTRNKALGLNTDADKNNILFKTNRTRSEFNQRAKEIVSSISKMKDFLLEHRKDYINVNYLIYEASHMTDSERDRIDRDSQQFMHTCREIIRNLRKEVRKQPSTQLVDHQEAVIHLLEGYLKSACKIYTEQKAIRVKRAYDKQKLSRLEPEAKKGLFDRSEVAGENASEEQRVKTEASSLQSYGDVSDLSSFSSFDNVEISSEELQMFEQENQKLYEEMNTMTEEVKQIEGRVIEISQLQKVFAEKVLEQDEEVNRIAHTLAGATENVKDGNEEIRQAMKKNAAFRVVILFFLLMLSFSLLFLDWYNP